VPHRPAYESRAAVARQVLGVPAMFALQIGAAEAERSPSRIQRFYCEWDLTFFQTDGFCHNNERHTDESSIRSGRLLERVGTDIK
jgi:hypothetical protein